MSDTGRSLLERPTEFVRVSCPTSIRRRTSASWTLDAEAPQLLVEVRALQPEALGRTGHVPLDLLQALKDQPPLDLRQGDFAKRVRPVLDRRALQRIALWTGCILLILLLTTLVSVARQHMEASRLDRESLALAQQVLPNATDAAQAQVELESRLAARGAGGRAFTAPVAALLAAMQDAPGVALTSLSRDPDGMVRATLASAKAEDINIVLLALQAAGFTITATPSQDPGGRTLAEITVRA